MQIMFILTTLTQENLWWWLMCVDQLQLTIQVFSSSILKTDIS